MTDERDVIAEAEHEADCARRLGAHVQPQTLERLRAQRATLRAVMRGDQQAPAATRIEQLKLLARTEKLRHEIEMAAEDAKLETFVRIHQALARLRALSTPQELIEAAPAELINALGVTRAMVSRVRGSLWTPEVLKVADGADPEESRFQQFVAEAEIPLAHMLMESELVRRRLPVLVADPSTHARTHRPIVEAARSTSYVAAPIMPSSRVIGFFHVDRFGQDLPVTPQDRDSVWVFAEHFGLLYERSVLVERIQVQRTQLTELLNDTIASLDDSEDQLRLARADVADPPPRVVSRGSRSPVDLLLTAREQEVLELMATGATNGQIARELIVSEGTVKSHVKRILRKLHVENRAGAVARYLGMMRRAAG